MRFGMALFGVVVSCAPGVLFAASAGVVAECKLLESAYLTTQKAGLEARPDILVGCPGFEGFQETMTNRDNRKAFAAAARTKVPAKAKAMGKPGKILFQRMIARGTPPAVAVAMVDTELFDAAVAQFGK